MLLRRLRSTLVLFVIACVAAVAACSGSKGTGSGAGAGTTTSLATGGGGSGGATTTGLGGSFLVGSGGSSQTLDVQPTGLQTITVTAGTTMPTVSFMATLGGQPTNVTWSVDRGDLATITGTPASTGVLAPTGTTGGMVTVIALQGMNQVQRQVFIKLQAPTQNGADPNNPAQAGQIATTPGQLTQGGGVGGVGGEGLGPPVSNFPATTMPAAMGLKLLYPYDKTVWPRGLLAPLLMWDWTPGDADAIQIHLETTSGSFAWTGQFGKPSLSSAFVRHPIPQNVWDMATNTAGGPTPNGMPDQLVLSLTVAKGGVAYGPLTETWTVAPGRLAGTVYYNSYGTQLVKNSTDPDYNGHQYGAAVLGIKAGATGPVVVAGPASGYDGSGCRVCHVVAADGSRLIVQRGNQYSATSTYDLKNGNAENQLGGYEGMFGWAGLYPDGSMALLNTADLAASGPASQLYAFPPTSKTPLAVTGIPSNLQAGAPAFSPDGAHVAFDFIGGTIGTATGNGTQLVAMDFDKATLSFTNLRVLATMTGGKRAGFPSFFPTNDAVAFHYQIVNSNHRYNTWHGAEAQIWWSDLGTGTATQLSQLNGISGGTSYLPTGGTNHGDDTVLNYEPTVNPVVSGGYAWVVFTSRRLYGNLATHDPWLSDPRSYDATQYANVTCKKLWVAAVDIGEIVNGKFMQGVTPGTDPSHPAFYLPGQELVAGNARGFWVLDPCKADGESCQTGDQCCNGFCEPNGQSGALVCGAPKSGCSGLQEKCASAADCCDPNALCINGFCALPQQG